jgi:16S rRNA (guanine527-N7)-methyltransferase
MDKLITGAKKLGLTLSREQVRQFEEYHDEMLDWNQRINLTAITNPEEVQVRHFLDSLTIYPMLGKTQLNENLNILDVGTGAGFPGIPLKIAIPDIKLTLIEATAKKTEFLNYIISLLGLKDVKIITGRAEEVAHMTKYRAGFNIVISRAVAQLAVLAELTLAFCSPGGIVIAPKKGDVLKEVEEALKAIDTLGGSLREVRLVELDELIDDRYLVIIDKMSPTPDKYPRRSGIPEKRPIK